MKNDSIEFDNYYSPVVFQPCNLYFIHRLRAQVDELDLKYGKKEAEPVENGESKNEVRKNHDTILKYP